MPANAEPTLGAGLIRIVHRLLELLHAPLQSLYLQKQQKQFGFRCHTKTNSKQVYCLNAPNCGARDWLWLYGHARTTPTPAALEVWVPLRIGKPWRCSALLGEACALTSVRRRVLGVSGTETASSLAAGTADGSHTHTVYVCSQFSQFLTSESNSPSMHTRRSWSPSTRGLTW